MRRAAAVLRRAMTATVDGCRSVFFRGRASRPGSRRVRGKRRRARATARARVGRAGPRAVATTPGGLDALLLDAEEEEEEEDAETEDDAPSGDELVLVDALLSRLASG